jgi:serine/threonine protein kinase
MKINNNAPLISSLILIPSSPSLSLLRIISAQNSNKDSVFFPPTPSEAPRVLQLKDLIHVAILGSGTFGRVTLVQDALKDRFYALKTMLKSEIVLHRQQENVLNEKNVMMCCHHPFIIRLYATFKDERKLYMLLEFVQGGELFAIIHTNKKDGKYGVLLCFCFHSILSLLIYTHFNSFNIRYLDVVSSAD